MRIEFHKLVASDVSRIRDYYEDAAGRNSPMSFTKSCARFFKKPPKLPKPMRFANAILGA